MPIQSTNTDQGITFTTAVQTWIVPAGVAVTGPSDAVSSGYANNLLSNSGQIAGYYCVTMGGDLNQVANNAGGVINGGFYGVSFSGDGSQLTNAGLVSGQVNGVTANADRFTLQNSGQITSGDVGVAVDGAGASVANDGQISGGRAIVFGAYAGEQMTLVNTGEITGTKEAFELFAGETGNGGVRIDNAGTIQGDVRVEATDAVLAVSLRNTGLIRGDITFGAGGDLFDGRAGAILGVVDGGGGNDLLQGGVGDDTLIGGSGRDRLDGGKGPGADTFVFTDVRDSRPSGADLITRHWGVADQIDVSAIDADSTHAGQQDFAFAGQVDPSAKLTTGAIGVYKQGGDTFVVADTSGDGAADFKLQIHGTFTLTADSFVL